ncbi:MAG: DUF4258 domain-containing protein [bacterium]
MNIIFTGHAKFEMKRRNIDEILVRNVIEKPEQKLLSNNDRVVFQSKYFDTKENIKMILRVICEIKHKTIKIITVYKTSKIQKYWINDGD